MNTHSHAVYTWLVATRLGGAGRYAAAAAAIGAALPDLPYLAKGAYLVARHRRGLTRELFLDELDYVRAPAWTPDLALHSLLPVGTLLAVSSSREGQHGQRAATWFLLGWASHNVVDLVTHASDARPHLWPLSGWRWRSPLSYWDPNHHAVPVLLAEHVPLLALAARRFVRRRRRVTPTG
jgi:membrane-bound metal-dependent hydrolase YbcI (DUF457 family)